MAPKFSTDKLIKNVFTNFQPGRPLRAGYVATSWKATETALRLLEKNADAFPPLKSAVGGLIASLDLAKVVIRDNDEYTKLAVQFKDTASALVPYASKLAASDARGSIALILKSIDEELVEINRQLERGKVRRAVGATDDQGDILERYRKIDSLFRFLILSDVTVTIQNHVEIGKLREEIDAILLRTLSPVDDARYNSAYSTAVKRRGCTASTREQILVDLRTWVLDPSGSKVFWMNGMAGTGKTTILYSFCEWLEGNELLAGNFFCSRASTACRDLNNIVRSIAYQLAHYSPTFRSELCKILEEKQNPHTLNVGDQFKWLVAMPLENSKDAIPDCSVIVIDALDECGDVVATALFLKVLMTYATHLPIKFLVASRPEPVILKNMEAPNFSPSMLRLHDIEQSLVEADIRQYLQEALYTMSPVPPSDIIDQLTRRSGNLFIYAATVARYVNPEGLKANSAQKRLKMILSISSSSAGLQYQELDNLYTSILVSAFDKGNFDEEELKIAALVLRTVVCAIEPMTTSVLSTILAIPQEDVARALSRLQSVLHVQAGPSGLVSVFHPSFCEFLIDKARSREFYCDIVEHNTKIELTMHKNEDTNEAETAHDDLEHSHLPPASDTGLLSDDTAGAQGPSEEVAPDPLTPAISGPRQETDMHDEQIAEEETTQDDNASDLPPPPAALVVPQDNSDPVAQVIDQSLHRAHEEVPPESLTPVSAPPSQETDTQDAPIAEELPQTRIEPKTSIREVVDPCLVDEIHFVLPARKIAPRYVQQGSTNVSSPPSRKAMEEQPPINETLPEGIQGSSEPSPMKLIILDNISWGHRSPEPYMTPSGSPTSAEKENMKHLAVTISASGSSGQREVQDSTFISTPAPKPMGEQSLISKIPPDGSQCSSKPFDMELILIDHISWGRPSQAVEPYLTPPNESLAEENPTEESRCGCYIDCQCGCIHYRGCCIIS
ncbi:hypothetical protein CPC08DRAFT_266865 [Agrocybe pediades]|nr:hypothetical protein CPC08DRAFT_266865 [Agrocybe pediades]